MTKKRPASKDVLTVRLQNGSHITGFQIKGCPLGEGLLDVPRVMRTVCSSGLSPHLLVEAWMNRLESEEETLRQEESWIRRGIDYLKKTQMEIEGRGGESAENATAWV